MQGKNAGTVFFYGENALKIQQFGIVEPGKVFIRILRKITEQRKIKRQGSVGFTSLGVVDKYYQLSLVNRTFPTATVAQVTCHCRGKEIDIERPTVTHQNRIPPGTTTSPMKAHVTAHCPFMHSRVRTVEPSRGMGTTVTYRDTRSRHSIPSTS